MSYTISDIAKICGVSKATVSRVINNKTEGVGEKTRKRVLETIEELNYRPNTVARSIATSRTNTIGMIIPDISYILYNELLRGVDDYISSKGYIMMLTNTYSDPNKEKEHLLSFVDKRVDGVIICSGVSNDDFLREYKKYNTPFVLIGRAQDQHLSDGSVSGDNFSGAFDATEFLIGNKNKNILYLDGTSGISGTIQKLDGYKKALEKHKIPFNSSLIVQGEYTIEFGYHAIKKLVKENVDFSAVFCGSDMIAIGVLKALQELNISVPGKVELIGFDGIELSEITSPSISTVAKPHYEMATEAAKILLSLIDEKPNLMRHLTIQPTLVQRQTTKKQPK